MKISKQDQIDSILDNFDFEKVRKAMKSLNWTWVTSDSEDEVPKISELRKEARRLLKDVASSYHYRRIGCGGLIAEKDDDNCLSLSFKIDEWCGYYSFPQETIFE